MLAPPAHLLVQNSIALSTLPAAVTGDNNVLSAELAPGLGETLAAGTRGSPWRLEVEKGSAAVTVAAFASFGKVGLSLPWSGLLLASPPATCLRSSAVPARSLPTSFPQALLPPGAAAGLAATNGAVYAPPSSVGGNTVLAPPPAALQAGMHPQTVDYSQQPMSGMGGQSPGVEGGLGGWAPAAPAARCLAATCRQV